MTVQRFETLNATPNADSDGDGRNDALLTELLERTSRTFALAIPCLPFPARKEVMVAYLLFRIVDTIEDGVHLDRVEKLAALERFAGLLRCRARLDPPEARLDLPRPPLDNSHYLALLDELPLVIATVTRLDPAVRDAILRRALISVSGMERFISAGTPEGKVRLRSVEELRSYCYSVAGVVGEMLTEIFIHGAHWLGEVRQQLDENARWFGEGLQLVNILKDAADDQRDGRVFIPDESMKDQLFKMAREDLRKAEAYVDALRRAEAPHGFLAFTQLPLQLAWRTLEHVEAFGPSSKLPRRDVMNILAQTLSGTSPPEGAEGVAGVSEVAEK